MCTCRAERRMEERAELAKARVPTDQVETNESAT
jgi:hypothetical protein